MNLFYSLCGMMLLTSIILLIVFYEPKEIKTADEDTTWNEADHYL